MDALELHCGTRLLAVFSVDARPVEIGRALGCDIVLDDPAISPRHWWLARRGGTIVAHDLSGERRTRRREQHVPTGQRWGLGGDYWLRRVTAPPGTGQEPATCRLSAQPGARETKAVRLRVREGERRVYRLNDRPLDIGRDGDNDVVLSDSAVSSRHCRIEPHPGGLLVRDLGSRNGTYVQGVRVERAILTSGAVFRVGGADIALEAHAEPDDDRRGLVAVSPQMQAVLAEARRHADLPWPVLVRGESGTGKEGIATALHHASARSSRPLVTLNAGALSEALVESELFGHERGAFTGAHQCHRGVFEQAHGGTLFLDEIGELPLSLQARLLRVLETGQVRRVGSEAVRTVQVRLVGATHRDLRAMVATGRFREDLYYRLARLVLEIPPLRDRPGDVLALAEHFMREMVDEVGPRSLSDTARERLLGHPFHGNARELRNVLSSAAVGCAGPMLCGDDIGRAIERVGGPGETAVTRADIERVLGCHGGNQSAAARALGIPRSTLRGRLANGTS